MMRIRLALCALVLGGALFSAQATAEGTTITVGQAITLEAEEVSVALLGLIPDGAPQGSDDGNSSSGEGVCRL